MKKQKEKVNGDVKKFTINRAKWWRGKGDRDSRLLKRNGMMCCLGFYAKSCGFDDKDIRNFPYPEEMQKGWNTFLLDKYHANSLVCRDMMYVNDSRTLTDDEREKKLAKSFAKKGVKVKFVGKKND